MRKCDDILTSSCGKKTPARCVDYEGEISDNSALDPTDCQTAHSTIQDLYGLVEELHNKLDLSDLGENCIDYNESPISLKTVLLKFEELLCAVDGSGDAGSGVSFDINGIDTECLIGVCSPTITTLTELLQAIVTKVCQLEQQINLDFLPQHISNAAAIAAGLSVGDKYWVSIGSIEAAPGTLRRVI